MLARRKIPGAYIMVLCLKLIYMSIEDEDKFGILVFLLLWYILWLVDVFEENRLFLQVDFPVCVFQASQ